MIRVLSASVMAALLIVLQTTLLEIVLLHSIGLELSLLLVLYAGFRYRPGEGAVISVICGFFMDCMTGSPTGLFMLLYVLIFAAIKLVSMRMYTDNLRFIAWLVFAAALAEGALLVVFYRMGSDMDFAYHLLRYALPQAFVLALLSPLFFKGFDVVEDRLNGKTAKQTG